MKMNTKHSAQMINGAPLSQVSLFCFYGRLPSARGIGQESRA